MKQIDDSVDGAEGMVVFGEPYGWDVLVKKDEAGFPVGSGGYIAMALFAYIKFYPEWFAQVVDSHFAILKKELRDTNSAEHKNDNWLNNVLEAEVAWLRDSIPLRTRD